MLEEKISYCDSCEEEFPKSELVDAGDPFGWGPRYWICDSCNEAAYDRYIENLYS